MYAILLRPGDTTALDLGDVAATFDVRWFNPRTGGLLQKGSVTTIEAPGRQPLGTPPTETNKDWIVLITKSAR